MVAGGAQQSQVLPLERVDALSISELYDEVEQALARVFPRGRQLWVRGEVQSLSDRTGHCYIDLVDPEGEHRRDAPVLKVKCWRTTWGPLKALLHDQGLDLQPGTVVTLRGRVDLYRARGDISFIVSELDVSALLGRVAARRAALIAALEAEGLLHANRSLPVPPVPLRIGLVSSPGTEGHRDFLGQLQASPFAFTVLSCPAQVQGPQAPASLAAALQTVAAAGCDLAVMVRGGGSRGDLAAFDAEPVARAVATATVPVWTGIGHTGDQSVADLSANRSFITPTECGQELVRTVAGWWGSVGERSLVVARRAEDALAVAARADTHARARLVSCTRHQLDRHAERLAAGARQLALQAPRQLEEQAVQVAARRAKLGPGALAQLQRIEDRLQAWRRLLGAYDPERQLERGYTLTLDAAGRPLRSAADVQVGAELTTRFADGTAHSTVTSLGPAAGPTRGRADASSTVGPAGASPAGAPAGAGDTTHPPASQEVP